MCLQFFYFPVLTLVCNLFPVGDNKILRKGDCYAKKKEAMWFAGAVCGAAVLAGMGYADCIGADRGNAPCIRRGGIGGSGHGFIYRFPWGNVQMERV